MIYKFALCDMSPINISTEENKVGMIRTAAGRLFVEPGSEKAKIIESEIKKHPTALFFRAKAIKANEPNSNGDYFSEEELKRSYKSFEGVPFFTNHDNQNVENARGKIIFAEWVPEEKSIYTISFVDREAYPHICRSIEEEYITGVSMGSLNGNAMIVMKNEKLIPIKDIVAGDIVISAFGNECKVLKVYSANLHKPMYQLKIEGHNNNLLLSDDHPVFVIKNKNSVPEFIETKKIQLPCFILIPLTYKGIKFNLDKISLLDNDNSFFITKYKNQLYLSCKINDIIEVPFDEKSYDIKVEGDESYIADGVAVHNCSVEYSVCNICGNKAEKTEQYCFVPNTPILMSDLSIKEIQNIVVGDEVRDAFGNITKVSKTFVHDVNEEMTILYTKAIDGELISTHNHPYLSRRRGKWTFIPAEFLDDKENLFTPVPKISYSDDFWNEISTFGFIDTEDNRLLLSKFLGYYVAEGCLLHNADKKDIGVEISLHSNETEYLKEIILSSEKIFNKTPEVIDRNIYNHKCKSIRIYSELLVGIIKASCVGLAKNKQLSKNILSLDKKYIKQVLAGYIDGDGYSDDYGSIIITTSSRQLASQIFNLLLSLRVGASINSYFQNGGPNNRDDKSYKIFRVQIASKQLEPIKDCGFKCARSFKIAQNRCDQNKAQNCFSEEGMMKYSAIDVGVTYYSGPVYNIETEANSYVANNTSVHNCSHIRERKGRTFSGKARNVVTGETKEFNKEPVFEYNYGIKFIELSAVVDPACPSCRIQALIKNDDIVKKVANIQNSLYVIKTAAIEKQAGQEEIQQLNETLKVLESISVKLIQNRQQVEVEFASDLVGILSELQTFVDELVGAGYGSVQAIPGVAGASQAPQAGVPGVPELPPAGLPEGVTPVASETPIPGVAAQTPAVGTISGSPTSPLVKSPKLPITAPAKPIAFDGNKIQKIAKTLENLITNTNNMGDEDMGKRLTVDAKLRQKKAATEVLSNSWQEKHNFFEYINRVPSVQDNQSKLSIKKRDDSFIIVAESKIGDMAEHVWTYEMLNEQEKEMIKVSPKEAASYFLNRFASNLKTKKGEAVMTNNMKEAGAKSVNKSPEVVTEAQLEEKGLYHSRTDESKNQITERQLDEKRSGEKDVITESQLNEKSNKLHPRTDESVDVITESQLDEDGVSPRSETPNVITQSQLDANRTGTEQDVITEKQLSSIDSPWARAAKRNSAMFKSAGDHMKAVVDVMANTVIATGCTPDEITQVASSLVASTKDRFELGNAILDSSKTEDVNYSKRLAYWSNKNIKVAGVGVTEIANALIKGLQKVASDVTINPETIIDAMDIVSESKEGFGAISKAVDQKLASAQKETVKSSKKDELRKALAESLIDKDKEAREQERKEIIASLDKPMNRKAEKEVVTKTASKKADTIVETTFDEMGCKSKDDAGFKSAIKSFARGALASQNIKIAAITNVTISGDTISIAVQTDAGEQGVEIPVGKEISPADGEVVPEADMSGEGLEANVGSELDPITGLPMDYSQKAAKSKKNLKKEAQLGGQGGGIPGTPGGVTAPGAPEAGLPGAAPADEPIQALTIDDEKTEIPDEIPTAGQQQPPWAICPECGSSNSDVTKEEDGGIKGACNDCGAEYEALVKKEIEFKVTKPTRSVGAEESTGEPEAPEVPALPVAAQVRLDKGSIVRVSSNQAKHGHVCPACGMKQCKASVEGEGHTEYKCPACNTDVNKDVIINVNNPEESYLRIKWDLVPNTSCASCKEAATKFASILKVQGMIKQASNGTTKFPMANCIERVARKWGGNSVATFGPCKGKPLADCVCGQLEKLGLNKVRHLEKLASVYVQKDPMDECIADQMKNKYARTEAETICKCLKKKFASKSEDNPFFMAFADDIKAGKEKLLTAQDLGAINDVFTQEDEVEEPTVDIEEDIDISAPLDVKKEEEVKEQETVTIEVSQETAQELADAAKEAAEQVKVAPVEEVAVEETTEAPMAVELEPEVKDNITEEEKDMAIAMQTHKIVRVGEEIIKVAATPTKVKDIEGNVEAKVPRSEQKLGDESKADSLMNKPNKEPEVPRKDAYMGKEKDADSLINKELKLPDVAVDSSYMGKEKENQSGMPAINNEIKGTVIAKEVKNVKEAKKLKEVETVEKDVEAKVPRNDQKLGEEAKADSLINEPNKGPTVPRSKAYMGKEKDADSLINKELETPDVPVDSAYMGHEKDVQKGMPAINDEYLKNVQQKKDVQLERISTARRMKAVEAAAKLLATRRISEEAYENVVEALSKFEIDKIVTVAENMYPRVKKQAESTEVKETYAGPAIVMESKEVRASNTMSDFQKKLEGAFTVGSQSFDKSLTQYGEK